MWTHFPAHMVHTCDLRWGPARFGIHADLGPPWSGSDFGFERSKFTCLKSVIRVLV